MTIQEQPLHTQPESSLSTWREQDASAWLNYTQEDLLRLPDIELTAFDQTLTQSMHQAGHSGAKTLEEFRQKLMIDSGIKRLPRKATVDEHRQYIKEQLKRFHQLQETQRAAQVAKTEQQEVTTSQQLSQRAAFIAEQSFTEWNAARQTRDEYGQPTAMLPRDQRWVDRVEESIKLKGPTSEKGRRYEVGFFRWLDQVQAFGPQAETQVHPASRFDDLKNGVDGIVMITIPDADQGSRIIPVGIDFTFSGNEMDLAWKLSRVQSEPVSQITYGAGELPAQQRFLRTVVSVDEARIQRMTQHLYLAAAAQEYPEGANIKRQGDELLAKYQDHDVFMAQVTDEIYEQIAWGREVLKQRDSQADVKDHDALLTYLDVLRTVRKDLHSRARAEVEVEGVGAYYRTQDAEFIRHAPDVLAAAGRSVTSAVA